MRVVVVVVVMTVFCPFSNILGRHVTSVLPRPVHPTHPADISRRACTHTHTPIRAKQQQAQVGRNDEAKRKEKEKEAAQARKRAEELKKQQMAELFTPVQVQQKVCTT